MLRLFFEENTGSIFSSSNLSDKDAHGFDFLAAKIQLKRHAKRVINLNTQVDDREASAQWLADEGFHLFFLLKRFGLNYEHRMKDTQEKERLFLLESLGKIHRPQRMDAQMSIGYPLIITRLKDRKTQFFRALSLENDDFSPQKKITLRISTS